MQRIRGVKSSGPAPRLNGVVSPLRSIEILGRILKDAQEKERLIAKKAETGSLDHSKLLDVKLARLDLESKRAQLQAK